MVTGASSGPRRGELSRGHGYLRVESCWSSQGWELWAIDRTVAINSAPRSKKKIRVLIIVVVPPHVLSWLPVIAGDGRNPLPPTQFLTAPRLVRGQRSR